MSKIKIPDRKLWLGDVNVVMHRKCAREDLGGFWRKTVELSPASEEDGLTFACSPKPGQVALCRVHTWFGGDGKASIERLSVSPYVEKPFKLKGNKKFRTRTKKSCFFVFRYSYVSMYICLWTFYARFTYSCMGMLHWWL